MKRGVSSLVLPLAVVALLASSADAGVLDWLFPGRAARQARRWEAWNARTTYRPYWDGYRWAGYGSTPYAYSGYDGTWGGWNQIPTTAQYAPRTAYRTVWSPVPMTTYAPSVDGNFQQPLTSYQWQTRRVPYVTFQPSYAAAGVGNAGTCCGGTTAAYGGWQSLQQPTSVANAGLATSPAWTSTYRDGSTGWSDAPSGGCAQCATVNPAPSTDGSEWRPVNESAQFQPVPADTAPTLEQDRNSFRPRLESESDEDPSTWRPVEDRYGSYRPYDGGDQVANRSDATRRTAMQRDEPPRELPRFRINERDDLARSKYYRQSGRGAEDLELGRPDDAGYDDDRRTTFAEDQRSRPWRSADDWRSLRGTENPTASATGRTFGMRPPIDTLEPDVPPRSIAPEVEDDAPFQLIPDPSREAHRVQPAEYRTAARVDLSNRWAATPLEQDRGPQWSRPSAEGWQTLE